LVKSKHRRVVADAGPLIAFARLNLLALLPEMFGTLIVLETVLNLCRFDSPQLVANTVILAKARIQRLNPLDTGLRRCDVMF